MRKFTAIIDNGEKEDKIPFHSRFRRGSSLNQGDLKCEMTVRELDCDKWRIVKISPEGGDY